MATPFSPGVPLPATSTAALASPSVTPAVTVFGASWAKPDSALYAESVALGEALAKKGFAVVNGGYFGTMEGVAKGAAAVDGSRRVGVLVPELFRHRKAGNEVR